MESKDAPNTPDEAIVSDAGEFAENPELNGLRFIDMFVWLSRSMKKVSQSHFAPPNVLPQPKFIVSEDKA